MRKKLSVFCGVVAIVVLLVAVAVVPEVNGGEDPPYLASNVEIINIL